jgi:hypothetical protein
MAIALLPLLILLPVLMPLWLPKVWPGLSLTVPRVPGYVFFIPLLLLVPVLMKMRRIPWRYALCEPHQQEARRWLRWERVVAIAIIMGLLAASYLWKGSTGAWPGIAGALVSVVFSKGARGLRLKRRKGDLYFFNGCGPEFLAQFPEWPEPR